MDLTTRSQYPIIRPHEEKRVGNTLHVSGGMNMFPLDAYSEIKDGKYTLIRTGEQFTLLGELKKCCLFGPSGVARAFSNVCVLIDVALTIGRITRIDFTDYLPEGSPERDLILVAHPIVPPLAVT